MATLNLRPPEQQPPSESSFDCRPGSIRRWIEQLPMGNMAESAKLLQTAIYEANRQQMSLDQRMHMLEALATPLHTILAGLIQRLSGQQLPLPATARHLEEFTHQLIAEIIIGYQIVLDGEKQGSWLFRLTHHELWPLCVHRILHYLGLLYQTHKLPHQPCPKGLWLASHRLFSEANTHGHRGVMLPMPWENGRRESIEQCYIQLLLTALLESSLLPLAQWEKVQQQLPRWSLLVNLHTPDHWQADLSAYWIRLDQDTPHTSSASQTSPPELEHAEALLLDLGALQRMLDEQLQNVTHNKSAPHPLLPATLAILSDAWRVSTGPRELRHHSHSQRRVAIGLSALFNLLRRENHHHDGIRDQVFSDALSPLLAVAKKPASKSPSATNSVWDSIFFATEIAQNSWSMDGDEAEYSYINAHEVDYSTNGYCLEFHASELRTLSTGELLGFSQHPGGAMQLCEVRWIQEANDNIQAGVMALASDFEPILCIMHENDQRTPLACLLGIGYDQHPQLFLPNLPGLGNRQLSLVVDKHEVAIELLRCNAQSPLFIAHGFRLHPQLRERGNFDDDMDIEELNRRLHQVVHSTAAPTSSNNDFSDLWDTL